MAKKKVNPRKALENLKPTSKNLILKLQLLVFLIDNLPYRYSADVIDKKIVPWARRQGFHVKLTAEDRTSWWSCSLDSDEDED